MFPPLQLCNWGRNQNALQLALFNNCIAWLRMYCAQNGLPLFIAIQCGGGKVGYVRKQCGCGEVEDVGHFVLRCEYVAEERERIEGLMGEKEEGWYEMESNEKVVMMMD